MNCVISPKNGDESNNAERHIDYLLIIYSVITAGFLKPNSYSC